MLISNRLLQVKWLILKRLTMSNGLLSG